MIVTMATFGGIGSMIDPWATQSVAFARALPPKEKK